MTKPILKTLLQVLSVCCLLGCVLAAVWGYRTGILTSRQTLEAYVSGSGMAGAALFMAFQSVQVVIPLLPGFLGCAAGVFLFGAAKGFVFNYLGICIGSVLAFGIARFCGQPLLPKLFSRKTIEKYRHWTGPDGHFEKWFTIAIFLPVAPDDFLCYLAGTTQMRWRKFLTILLLGKPFVTALYSLAFLILGNQMPAWMGS